MAGLTRHRNKEQDMIGAGWRLNEAVHSAT
jgi:hypothetical protein